MEHRPVHPARVIERAEAVAAGVEAVVAVAGAVEHPGMGVEHLADRSAGLERRHRGHQGVVAGAPHVALAVARAADAEGPHQAGVVAAVGAGELQRELVLGRELAAPGEVAAQQRVAARGDDELVAGIVAAAAENRALHGGENVAFVDARPGQLAGRAPGGLGETGGAPDIGELGRALHQAQPADQLGGVDQRAEAVERLVDHAQGTAGQPVGLELDAEPLAAAAMLVEDRLEPGGRGRAGLVDPDADVGDDRGVPRLAQVRRPRQQGQGAVGAEIEALEEHEAEAVIPGQVEHALLAEHQQPVQSRRFHGLHRRPPPPGQLAFAEVQGHRRRRGRGYPRKRGRTSRAKRATWAGWSRSPKRHTKWVTPAAANSSSQPAMRSGVPTGPHSSRSTVPALAISG